MPAEEPSKSVLLERREERELVTQAWGVLDEQRDLLAHQLLVLIHAAEALEVRLAEHFTAARHAIRAAVMRHGSNGIRRWARMGTALEAPRWQVRRLFGTRLVEENGETAAEPAPTLPDSPEISLELERAVLRFHRLLWESGRLAIVYNNLARVADTFRRAQRRVNALEHIVLPELEQAIRRIESFLEEAERENLVRTHRLKKHQRTV